MKTHTVKILAAVISAVLLFLCLSACATPQSKGDDTTTAAADPDIAEPGTTADPAEQLSLPEDLNLGGATMGVLYWSDVENLEFFSSDPQNIIDKVEDAINRRNRMVEERMQVTLDFIPHAGNAGNLKSFVSFIDSSIQAGDHSFDIIAGYSQTMANAAYNNYLYDLNSVSHLDLDKPWWPSLLTKEATVNDRIFFVSGDISTNLLYMMYTVFFNKELLATRPDLASPYALVADNEWTIDKMIEMCTDFYRDADDVAGKSDGDQYGLVLPKLAIDAFFYGSGMRTTEKTTDGSLVTAESFFGERSQSLLDKLEHLCYDTDDGLWCGGTGIFAAGRSLFHVDRAVSAIKHFGGDVEVEFGVVPAPKWDRDQDAYYTCAGNPFTLYGIVTNSSNPDIAAAVLECWAYNAYNTTTPAIFEVSMKTRYAKDSESAQMYDLIRDGVTFDLGRIYGITLQDLTQTLYRNAMTNRSEWSRTKISKGKILSTLLEGVNEAYYK